MSYLVANQYGMCAHNPLQLATVASKNSVQAGIDELIKVEEALGQAVKDLEVKARDLAKEHASKLRHKDQEHKKELDSLKKAHEKELAEVRDELEAKVKEAEAQAAQEAHAAQAKAAPGEEELREPFEQLLRLVYYANVRAHVCMHACTLYVQASGCPSACCTMQAALLVCNPHVTS